jgi:hypothetical protein
VATGSLDDSEISVGEMEVGSTHIYLVFRERGFIGVRLCGEAPTYLRDATSAQSAPGVERDVLTFLDASTELPLADLNEFIASRVAALVEKQARRERFEDPLSPMLQQFSDKDEIERDYQSSKAAIAEFDGFKLVRGMTIKEVGTLYGEPLALVALEGQETVGLYGPAEPTEGFPNPRIHVVFSEGLAQQCFTSYVYYNVDSWMEATVAQLKEDGI